MTNQVSGFFICGSGGVDSHNNEVKVCKIKHLNDYKIVNDWVDYELK